MPGIGQGCLNKLIMHEDIPFFWDNWDIMHHAYESKATFIQEKLKKYELLESSDKKIVLRFEFQISSKSKLEQQIIFHANSPRIDFKT